jgi:hypothetical protein
VTDQLLDDLKAALGDAYLIERELTGGGMSRVFVAREHALGREVVIKVLPPELAAGINRERFRREIQLAARISHPYIVPLHHAGEAGELLWFTMPYIAGESLRTRLEKQGPLSVRETVQLLRDVVEALSYAHSRGVIHRDIKPANILSDGAHALVTDFGVAKALGASLPLQGVAGHTTSGMAIGTPAYMAPEQLAADPSADHRVDIYAVGLLAYELLAGASPFAAPSPTATMTAQLTRVPQSLSLIRPDVPSTLAQLVDRCLAKQADDRPSDAQAVMAELDRISGAMAADAHREVSGERAGQAAKAASSWPLIFAAAAVLTLMVGGLWWTGRGGDAPAAAPETVLVQGGTDSLEGASLPAQRPMTRADSLAIAAALREDLERIDPEAARSAPVASTTPATPGSGSGVGTGVTVVSLDRQLTIADSLVRVKLAEMTNRSAEALIMAERSIARGAASVGPAPGTARKKVMVVPGGGRDRDPALQQLSMEIVRDLNTRLARGDQWEVVAPESVREGGEDELPAEVLVTVSANRAGTDSATVRIGVRNLTPGSQFGYNVLTSNTFALADGSRGYRMTVGQAYEVLSDLRRLDRGQQWNFDMGRTGTRVFTPEQIRAMDSLRRVGARPPNVPTAPIPQPQRGPQ